MSNTLNRKIHEKIPCMLMRGGTSKGVFLLADDLPKNIQERDELILAIMGSGHALQIDGIGGGSPQTSKVAIISRSPTLMPTLIIYLLKFQ